MTVISVNVLTGETTTREMTPEEIAAILPASPPDPAIVLAGFTRAINAHVEAQARSWQYNSAAHLASYVASTVPQWSAEAQAFILWRDQVWLTSLAMLDAVQGGASIPESHQAFIGTLPALTRP